MRTPLTYFGGKQSLADAIVGFMPPHDVYLEPFAGGAAVLFSKPPAQRETLNDLDGAIVAFWRAVRDHPDALARAVALTPYSSDEWRACIDGLDDSSVDDIERARRLSTACDQSFARAMSGWSPPSLLADRRGRWQPDTWAKVPDKIVAAATRLRGICLTNADAVGMIATFDHPKTVIYCDPPYGGEHRRGRGDDYRRDITPDLWPRLTDALLAVKCASVLLSGYPSEHGDRLVAAGWEVHELRHRLSASARLGTSSELAPERLWRNPRCVDLATGRLFVDEPRSMEATT